MSTSKVVLNPIDEPWLSFLRAVDNGLEDTTAVHCIGGFALLLLVDNARPTGDVDWIDVVPPQAAADLERIAGRDSALAVEHKLYIQGVRIAEAPCDYGDRLLDATPPDFKKLQIKILDPYDLVLLKVQRAAFRDREDARSIIAGLALDRKILCARFDVELRPYLAVQPENTIRIFELWIDEFYPDAVG